MGQKNSSNQKCQIKNKSMSWNFFWIFSIKIDSLTSFDEFLGQWTFFFNFLALNQCFIYRCKNLNWILKFFKSHVSWPRERSLTTDRSSQTPTLFLNKNNFLNFEAIFPIYYVIVLLNLRPQRIIMFAFASNLNIWPWGQVQGVPYGWDK